MLVADEEGILLVAKKKKIIGNSESAWSLSGFVFHGNAALIPRRAGGRVLRGTAGSGLGFQGPHPTWFGPGEHQQVKGSGAWIREKRKEKPFWQCHSMLSALMSA